VTIDTNLKMRGNQTIDKERMAIPLLRDRISGGLAPLLQGGAYASAKRGPRLDHPVEIMRLTLTYRGPRHAQTKKETRVPEKHAIRIEFHRQMKEAFLTYWRVIYAESREAVEHGAQGAIRSARHSRWG
jgi:hypothetical protein